MGGACSCRGLIETFVRNQKSSLAESAFLLFLLKSGGVGCLLLSCMTQEPFIQLWIVIRCCP